MTLKYCCAEANLAQGMVSVGKQLLSFVVYRRDEQLECRPGSGSAGLGYCSEHTCMFWEECGSEGGCSSTD